MAITVNLCYTGRNGNALRFVEEMTNSASRWTIRRRSCLSTAGKTRKRSIFIMRHR